MVYQVFHNSFYILYVEGDKRMIAENLINKYPLTKKYKFVGEYTSKESINNKFNGYFIDGYNNESYTRFIKEKGLVKLMCIYWNDIIEKEEIEKKRQLKKK